MAIDPVCGMTVDENNAAAISEYKGKKYYFCSTGCQKKFEAHPEEYLGSEGVEPTKSQHTTEKAPPPVQEEAQRSAAGTKAEKIDIPIVGMSCASCATTVQSGLRNLPGVDKADVNFATSKATVTYQPEKVNLKDLVKTVKQTGYNVGTVTAELPVQGMKCASCVNTIEKDLLHKEGITNASVNLATEKVRVEYIPSEIGLEEISKTIEDSGYKVLSLPKEEGFEDAEAVLREKEFKKLRTKFLAGLALGIVILLGSMPDWFPWVPDFFNNFFVLWVLSSPVQFWIGWSAPSRRWKRPAITSRTRAMCGSWMCSLAPMPAWWWPSWNSPTSRNSSPDRPGSAKKSRTIRATST